MFKTQETPVAFATMEENSQLDRKIAVVSGAAGAIGLAVVKALIEAGYKVGLIDLQEEAIKAISSSLEEKATAFPADLSTPEACANVAGEVKAKIGDPSVFVHCAGILSNNKIAGTSANEWRKVMAINVDSAFYLSREFLPAMKASSYGRIIMIGSLAAKAGGITSGPSYVTSKGALHSLTFSLAIDSAADGVTVNGVAPAYVRTPMVTDNLTEEQRVEILNKIPVHRFCEPEEVAHTVMFLVSPLSGFITGEMIDQNGGLWPD